MRAGHVGFVFQSFHLVPSLTALENVMLPLELARRRDAREVAREVLAGVGLAERVGHYPRQLSGGEQQRVAIARAFVGKPDVLFADEPTGNLDAATGEKIMDLLFGLNRATQTTLVLVTHDRAPRRALRSRHPARGGPSRRQLMSPSMPSLAFALRNLLRDLKSGELAVLVLALLVAVAALTAVGFFTSRIGLAVERQAGEVLAADLRLQSARPISEAYADRGDPARLARGSHRIDAERGVRRAGVVADRAARRGRGLSVARPVEDDRRSRSAPASSPTTSRPPAKPGRIHACWRSWARRSARR